MMRVCLPCLVAMALAAPAATQRPGGLPEPSKPPRSQSESQLRDQEHPLIVRGCIYGNQLKIDGSTLNPALGVLRTAVFELDGPKELIGNLNDAHEGHEEEIEGVVILPANEGDDVHSEAVRAGDKTRILLGGRTNKSGAGERGSSGGPRRTPARLKVKGITHIADTCGIPVD